ncbi:MAG: hypothetical protein EP329_21360 [Deltaproteobacteria bacterium]|nr:MAG: hypothetical protein EP329_21360 [Deltaproteobacteria bacterium]
MRAAGRARGGDEGEIGLVAALLDARRWCGGVLGRRVHGGRGVSGGRGVLGRRVGDDAAVVLDRGVVGGGVARRPAAGGHQGGARQAGGE